MYPSDSTQDMSVESKLWRAKQWIERLEAEMEVRQLALSKWKTYVESLQRIQELEEELDLEVGLPLSESAKGRTVTEALIVFGLQEPQHTFIAKDAIAWLVKQGLYSDDGTVGNGAYGILTHRKDLFGRQGRGLYRLTKKAIDIGTRLTQPELPLSHQPPRTGKETKHTRTAQFILNQLGQGGRTLGLLKEEANQAQFDFKGKKPGLVLHFALIGMAQHGLVEKVGDTWLLKH